MARCVRASRPRCLRLFARPRATRVRRRTTSLCGRRTCANQAVSEAPLVIPAQRRAYAFHEPSARTPAIIALQAAYEALSVNSLGWLSLYSSSILLRYSSTLCAGSPVAGASLIMSVVHTIGPDEAEPLLSNVPVVLKDSIAHVVRKHSGAARKTPRSSASLSSLGLLQ